MRIRDLIVLIGVAALLAQGGAWLIREAARQVATHAHQDAPW